MSDELKESVVSPADSIDKAPYGFTRRELFLMGNAIALPTLFSSLDATAAAAPLAGPLTPGPQIYQSIGVEPVINCRGTFTIIGGSVERPEVRAAMDAASKYFVQIDELADAVGRRFAELTGAEWGMVSAGCAAGLKHVTVACVTGGNPEKLIRIPDLTDLDRTEVVVPRSSRNVYDHAIRNVGVKMVTVDSLEELTNALCSRTAMIYLLADNGPSSGPMALDAVAQIAKPKNIPILVDAAAEVLTIPNVHLQRGATIVAYSGGKAICGPQCAGLLLGRKDILLSAWQASAPHHGPGRDNKVGREETLGMLAAVEAWVKRDHAAEWKTWLAWLDNISKRVTTINGVKTAVREPSDLSNKSPSLTITWDAAALNITGEELAEELAMTKPRIAVGAGMGGGRAAEATPPGATGITVTAWQMQPGDDKVVADRLHAALSQKRPPRSAQMPSPAADVSGRWDVDVEFSSSRSQHTLQVEQDGNWIQGSHKGDFSVRELVGMIEGDKVTLRSIDRKPGNSITFIFAGTLSGGTISGPIHLGEYLTAKFTAKRHVYSTTRTRIRVPSGPPLAT
jgi:D-glucosaminate-6-phosphate ammonia-lyase